MLLRLLAVAALLISLLPFQAWSQDYSNGIVASYELIPNLTYLEQGAWQGKLDLYVRADAQGPHPTLVFFHGGADERGSKEKELFKLLHYLELGWNVVNVEHRLPGVTLAPAAMQNGWCALRWVVRNAPLYGFDVNRIVLSGQSAGGWAALTIGMAPTDANWDQLCPGAESIKVAAIVNWYGVADPADLLEGQNVLPGVVGVFRGLPNPVAVANTISPLKLVRTGVPPVISVHGSIDGTVPHAHSVRLHDALKRAGVMEELVTIPKRGHGGFSRAENQNAYEAIDRFLTRRGLRALPVGEEPQRSTALTAINLDISVLDRYVGRYRAANGDVLSFTRQGTRFFVQQASSRQMPIELFASAERDFFVKSGSARVAFVLENQGRTNGVILFSNNRYSRLSRVE